jgi:multidrug resistance efflux pump
MMAINMKENPVSNPSQQYSPLSHLHDVFVFILGPEKSYYKLAMVYGVAISLLTLAVPFSVQMLVTTLGNTAMVRPVIILAITLFCVLLMYGILVALQHYVMELFKRRFYARITSEIILRNIYAAPGDAVDRAALADRYFEIMTVQHKLPLLITGGFAFCLQMLVGLLLVSSYHPALLVFNIILVFSIYGLWRWFSPSAIRKILALSKEKYAVAGWIEQLSARKATANSETLIAEDAENIVKSDGAIYRYLNARREYFIPAFRQIIGFLFLYALASASLLGIGGTLVVSGQLTLGQLVAAELVLSGIFVGISKAGDYLSYYYDVCAAVEKLSQFFRIPVKNVAEENLHLASFDRTSFTSLSNLKPPRITRTVARILMVAIGFILIFVTITPWIQTASGLGSVTTLNPSDRAQAIHSPVRGRINAWYVSDGMRVKKNDPIVEIKDNDPQLIERLQSERDAMAHKAETLQLAMKTAELNHHRQLSLSQHGLSSKKEFEQANIRWKEIKAQAAQAQADLNKVEVQLSRQHTQLVFAPRDGYILHITAGGTSTYVKEGDALATFVPDDAEPAVELYVSGLDIPLIYPGRDVRLVFEGWPFVQFSGWPSVAVGTFAGKVAAVDATISPNGSFRVLVKKPEKESWPDKQFLRMGARVKGWVLLNEVPVIYEIWRQLNSFPPIYDKPGNQPKHSISSGKETGEEKKGSGL